MMKHLHCKLEEHTFKAKLISLLRKLWPVTIDQAVTIGTLLPLEDVLMKQGHEWLR